MEVKEKLSEFGNNVKILYAVEIKSKKRWMQLYNKIATQESNKIKYLLFVKQC